jgi:hypothetical protein
MMKTSQASLEMAGAFRATGYKLSILRVKVSFWGLPILSIAARLALSVGKTGVLVYNLATDNLAREMEPWKVRRRNLQSITILPF